MTNFKSPEVIQFVGRAKKFPVVQQRGTGEFIVTRSRHKTPDKCSCFMCGKTFTCRRNLKKHFSACARENNDCVREISDDTLNQQVQNESDVTQNHREIHEKGNQMLQDYNKVRERKGHKYTQQLWKIEGAHKQTSSREDQDRQRKHQEEMVINTSCKYKICSEGQSANKRKSTDTGTETEQKRRKRDKDEELTTTEPRNRRANQGIAETRTVRGLDLTMNTQRMGREISEVRIDPYVGGQHDRPCNQDNMEDGNVGGQRTRNSTSNGKCDDISKRDSRKTVKPKKSWRPVKSDTGFRNIFKCSICYESFTNQIALLNHYRLHMNRRPETPTAVCSHREFTRVHVDSSTDSPAVAEYGTDGSHRELTRVHVDSSTDSPVAEYGTDGSHREFTRVRIDSSTDSPAVAEYGTDGSHREFTRVRIDTASADVVENSADTEESLINDTCTQSQTRGTVPEHVFENINVGDVMDFLRRNLIVIKQV